MFETILDSSLWAAVAVILGFLGSFIIYRLKVEDRREKTRRAIAREISIVGEDIETWANEIVDPSTDPQSIPLYNVDPIVCEIYKGTSTDIGLLSNTEVEEISDFYTRAIRLRRQYNEVINEDRTDHMSFHILLKSVVEVNQCKNRALNTINDNLSRDTQQERLDIDVDQENFNEIIARDYDTGDVNYIQRG